MDVSGKKVVLTGTFEHLKRKEAEAQLKALGATVVKSVSGKTDILFAGAKAGSKLAKASRLGVTVLGEPELMEILRGDEPQEALALDASQPGDQLAAAIAAVAWGAASVDDVAALTDTLTAHEARHGVTEAHREAWRRLKAAGRARLRTNAPHQTELVAWGLSGDGRTLATGTWCGDDYHGDPGNVALWQVATGRCVHVIEGVSGGVGWPDYAGCLQWSPGDRRLGLALDTNGVGYLDPFKDTYGVENVTYVTDGWSRPPGWCWAPDSARVFISCWGYRQSAEAGVIATPSPHNPAPVYMKMTGREGGDPEVQPFKVARWHAAADVVVGISGHDEAYALDMKTRTRIWLRRSCTGAALSPDGSRLALAGKAGLVLLDALTGEELPTGELSGSTVMQFAPDNARLAVEGRGVVRIVRDGALEGEIPVQLARMNNWNAPDLRPLAFSPDASMLVTLRGDRERATAEVWRLGAEPERLSEADVSGCWGVLFGDGVVIAAGKERLLFIEAATGRAIADHALYGFPASDPTDAEPTALVDKAPFPDGGDRWGYIGEGFLIAQDPSPRVQAVADRRFAWPLSWSGLPIEPDLRRAVQNHPEAFPPAIVKAYQKGKKARRRRLPFPLENEATADDLFDFLLDVLARSSDYGQADYYAEIAIHFARAGRVDEALPLLDHFTDLTHRGHQLAKVLAYLARSGCDAALVRGRLEAIEAAVKDLGSGYPARTLAWVAAARGALGDTEAAKGLWSRAARALGDDAGEDVIVAVATARAFAGRFEGAIALIKVRARSRPFWNRIAELSALVLEQGDLELLDRFLAELAPCEAVQHFEMMTHAIQACRDAGTPERAWELLEHFNRLSTSDAERDVIRNVHEVHGAEAAASLLDPRFERALQEGWSGSVGRLLGLWAEFVGQEGLEERAGKALDVIDVSRVNRWAIVDLCQGLCVALPTLEMLEELVAFYDDVPAGEPWVFLVGALQPDHLAWPRALERAMSAAKKDSHTRTSQRLLRAVKPYDEVYAEVADALIEAAGRDRLNLESLVRVLAEEGDLIRANTARMKLPKKRRSALTCRLGRAATAIGHYSAGIAMLSELEPGYGSHNSTYEAMAALVYDAWDGFPRASGVMG